MKAIYWLATDFGTTPQFWKLNIENWILNIEFWIKMIISSKSNSLFFHLYVKCHPLISYYSSSNRFEMVPYSNLQYHLHLMKYGMNHIQLLPSQNVSHPCIKLFTHPRLKICNRFLFQFHDPKQSNKIKTNKQITPQAIRTWLRGEPVTSIHQK